MHEADQRAVRLQPERPDLAQQPPPAVPLRVGGEASRVADVVEQRALEREVLLQSGSSAAGYSNARAPSLARKHTARAWQMRLPLPLPHYPPPHTHTHTLSRALGRAAKAKRVQ